MQFGELVRKLLYSEGLSFVCLFIKTSRTSNLSWISGLLGAGFGQFGSPEKLKQNPLQHLFEVSLDVWRKTQ